MMLKHDVYLPENAYCEDDFDRALEKIGALIGVSSKKISSLLTVIAAHTVYISHDELRGILPKNRITYNNRVSRRGIPPMLKAGLLERKNLEKPIGSSKCLYRLTEKGYEEASVVKGGLLTEKSPKRRKKKEIEKYIRAHNYCTGINYFQMLALGIPFTWEREKPYTYLFDRKNKKNGLQADAVCRLQTEVGERAVYFEQDMGTEANWRLLEKIQKYENHHLTLDADRGMILFSFFSRDAAISLNHVAPSAYSTLRAKALLDFMETQEADTLNEALAMGFDDREYAEELRETVRRADEHDVEESLLPYARKTRIDIPFMRAFVESLLSQTNPFRERELNLIHVNFVKTKLKGLVTPILSVRYRLPRHLRPLALGYQMLCVPTTLVTNRIPYAMLSLCEEKRRMIETALYDALGTLSFLGERHMASEIRYADMYANAVTTIRLRNIFRYQTKDHKEGYVAVEMPFMDMGAWLRVQLFAEGYCGEESVMVVCLLEDSAQAKDFFTTIVYRHDGTSIHAGRRGNAGVYGLTFRRMNRLFSHTGGGKLTDMNGDI